MADSNPRNSFNEAMEESFRRRRNVVRAIVERGGRGDSADLVQDAFLKTIEAGRTTKIESPVGFLFRVARNSVIDRLRKRSRWSRLMSDADAPGEQADLSPGVERSLIASERLSVALACIDAMPSRRREVFLLQRIEGLTYVKIAKKLGISAKTVEAHMSAAMLQLSREMDAYDDTD